MVAYNHAAFVRQCLDSFRDQTLGDFRLWIVDDNSSDNSSEIISNWAEENPQIETELFLRKKNQGLIKNLNEIIPKTSDEFLKIIAADDFVSPDYLEKNLEAARQSPAETGVFFSRASYVDEAGNVLPEKTYYQQDYSDVKDFKPMLFRENIVAAPSLFFRRSIFEKLGLYDETVFLEDYDLLLKALSRGIGFKFINETLTFYRTHSDNATKTRRKTIHEETALLKMRYDTQGKYPRDIHRALQFISENYGLAPALLKSYENYSGRNALFYFSMKKKLPNLWLKFLQKVV